MLVPRHYPIHLSDRVRYALAQLHRRRPLGLVEFADFLAAGYRAVQAKRMGLRSEGVGFDDVRLAVRLHGSSRWGREGGMQWMDHPDDPRLDFCERYAFEHADVQLSPSQYMLDYARGIGWAVRDDARIVPYVYPEGRVTEPADGAAQPPAPAGPTEVVFFGRLETRKGLDVFLEAVRRLDADVPVTFLGRETVLPNRVPAAQWIAHVLPGRRVSLVTDLNQEQALRYLSAGNRLAVIPSLVDNVPFTVIECATLGIPFIASDVGSIPELVPDEELRSAVLFRPDAADLTRRLTAWLGTDPETRKQWSERIKTLADPAAHNAAVAEAYRRLTPSRAATPADAAVPADAAATERASVHAGVAEEAVTQPPPDGAETETESQAEPVAERSEQAEGHDHAEPHEHTKPHGQAERFEHAEPREHANEHAELHQHAEPNEPAEPNEHAEGHEHANDARFDPAATPGGNGAAVAPPAAEGDAGRVVAPAADGRGESASAARDDASGPLVTVIVPHYNLPQFLPQTLESLAAQTYRPLEVIVVDDGSTDPEAARVLAEQERAYPQFRFVRQENAGPAAARNRGVAEAAGAWVVPFDADDLARPEMVRTLAAAVARNPGLSAVSCYMLGFDDPADIPAGRFAFAYRPAGGPRLTACLENVYGAVVGIFRKDDLLALGGYEVRSGVEDWELYVRLVQSGRQVDVVPEPLFYYRQRPGSVRRTHNLYRSEREILRLCHPWGEGAAENDPDPVGPFLLGLYRQLGRLHRRQHQVDAEFQELQQALAKQGEATRSAQAERDHALGEIHPLREAVAALRQERDQLAAGRDQLLAQQNDLLAQRDQLLAQQNELLAERDQFKEAQGRAEAERLELGLAAAELRKEFQALQAEHGRVEGERLSLQQSVDSLRQENQSLQGDRTALRESTASLETRLLASEAQVQQLKEAGARLLLENERLAVVVGSIPVRAADAVNTRLKSLPRLHRTLWRVARLAGSTYHKLFHKDPRP